MEIVLLNRERLGELATLFDQYRIFYRQPSELEDAKNFLRERFDKNDSVIFGAADKGKLVGFTQLYPSYSSVSMMRVWILNDLFVEKSYRRQGVARLLMDAARVHAAETGAVRIELATQISNEPAQRLYEMLGYVRDEEFCHYSLGLQ